MKHTKGPWVAVGTNVLLRDGTRICRAQKELAYQVTISKAEAEANARLIAAAPELLEMLEAFIDPISATLELRVKALAIIKKAKGDE